MGIGDLDDEVVGAADAYAGSNMVAQVDQLFDSGFEDVRVVTPFRLRHDPLRAQGEGGALAHAADVDLQGLDDGAFVEPHAAAVPLDFLDPAVELVVFADEGGHEGVLRLFIEFRWRRKLLDHTIVEDGNAIRHGERFRLVVGHIDDGYSDRLVYVLDFVLHLLAQVLVQRAQRLVHQDQVGIKDQGPHDRHALLLPAGKLCGPAVAQVAQLNHVEHPLYPFLNLRLRLLSNLQREGEVFGNRHVREERIVLKDHADAAAVWRHAVDAAPAQHDVATCCCFEAGQHHQAGGLAGSRGAQHRDEFALGDIEVQVFDDQGFAVIGFLDIHEPHEGFVRLAHALSP